MKVYGWILDTDIYNCLKMCANRKAHKNGRENILKLNCLSEYGLRYIFVVVYVIYSTSIPYS